MAPDTVVDVFVATVVFELEIRCSEDTVWMQKAAKYTMQTGQKWFFFFVLKEKQCIIIKSIYKHLYHELTLLTLIYITKIEN